MKAVNIPRISVVLNGSDNDKVAFQAAVRMAARERASVRVSLGSGCSHDMFEKHLDFVLWDVKQRLGLEPPAVELEVRLDAFSVKALEATCAIAEDHRG